MRAQSQARRGHGHLRGARRPDPARGRRGAGNRVPALTGPVEIGDEVIVNVQARQLELGTGGFDVVYANLTRGLDAGEEDGAHVMTLPYTPVQAATRHVEEADRWRDPERHARRLLLPPQPAGARPGRPGTRTASLRPARRGARSLSDTVRTLKRAGLLEVAVAASPCTDSDVQAVTLRLRSPGARRRDSTSSSARSAPGSWEPGRSSVTAGSPLLSPPTPRRRSAVGRYSPCACRRRTGGNATSASRTTSARSSTSASAT